MCTCLAQQHFASTAAEGRFIGVRTGYGLLVVEGDAHVGWDGAGASALPCPWCGCTASTPAVLLCCAKQLPKVMLSGAWMGFMALQVLLEHREPGKAAPCRCLFTSFPSRQIWEAKQMFVWMQW